MRQLTIGCSLALLPAPPAARPAAGPLDELLALLEGENTLLFVAVFPHGSMLKCISELLQRCAASTSFAVGPEGLTLMACDPATGRLIHVEIRAHDLLSFRFLHPEPVRYALETTSLYAVFNQLKRRDQVVLYGTMDGQVGSLVDYSGKQSHTKHSTIAVRTTPVPEYVVPGGYRIAGVPIPSAILQRILREYKTLSKRIILTGNGSYIHIQTDTRFSLHRSDNVFGRMDGHTGEDVSTELSISTLGRIQKITNFNPELTITCESGLPIRIRTQLGSHGSAINVYLEQDPGGAAAPVHS